MDTTDEQSLETIRKIRANPQLAKLPVIVSATNADRQGVLTLAGLKISGLLPKPVSLDDIKAILAKATQ
jgi:CheY-like chemotaxis protein